VIFVGRVIRFSNDKDMFIAMAVYANLLNTIIIRPFQNNYPYV